jgi:hypothetical protein
MYLLEALVEVIHVSNEFLIAPIQVPYSRFIKGHINKYAHTISKEFFIVVYVGTYVSEFRC